MLNIGSTVNFTVDHEKFGDMKIQGTLISICEDSAFVETSENFSVGVLLADCELVS